jgi:hypothetical protein
VRPLGTTEEFLLPTAVKPGDLIEFDGVWFPVVDMRTINGGSGRILLFDGRNPYKMTQAEIVFRPSSHNQPSP